MGWSLPYFAASIDDIHTLFGVSMYVQDFDQHHIYIYKDKYDIYNYIYVCVFVIEYIYIYVYICIYINLQIYIVLSTAP